MRHLTSWIALTIICTLTACSDNNDNYTGEDPDQPAPVAGYSAEIRRTEFCIPQIKADYWGSLGYGYGYAYSQDNFCV
ncbi:MAG: penicillin acylase family protein, partial [Halioglobus sp.]|nr:penicillin acylase family protein [Halioglobus sp.]